MNKKTFVPRTSDSTNEKKSVTRQESTKFKEFKLSMTKQNSDPNSIFGNAQQLFKATPLPKTTYSTHCMERKSAPPKITQSVGFNLNTDRRGSIERKKLSIESKKAFKSRPMPSFPAPGSPQRSACSTLFKGKSTFLLSNLRINRLEFTLHTNLRERKSAPPLR